MQGWGQVLGPGEGAIFYDDCMAWKGRVIQSQGGHDPWGRLGGRGVGSPREGVKARRQGSLGHKEKGQEVLGQGHGEP